MRTYADLSTSHLVSAMQHPSRQDRQDPEGRLRIDAPPPAQDRPRRSGVVVNPGGYVGESTGKEIAYARAQGKPVSFTILPDPDRAP